MYINLDKIPFPEKSVAKIINKIIATTDWRINREITDFIHDLNIHEVDEFNSVIIANGVKKTNTFNIMYLKEYENNKLNNPNDVKLFIIPSKEKTFNVLSVLIIVFIFIINSSKLIFVFNKSSPIALIAPDINQFIFIICSQIKYEQFTHTDIINNLKINWYGFSTVVFE